MKVEVLNGGEVALLPLLGLLSPESSVLSLATTDSLLFLPGDGGGVLTVRIDFAGGESYLEYEVERGETGSEILRQPNTLVLGGEGGGVGIGAIGVFSGKSVKYNLSLISSIDSVEIFLSFVFCELGFSLRTTLLRTFHRFKNDVLAIARATSSYQIAIK